MKKKILLCTLILALVLTSFATVQAASGLAEVYWFTSTDLGGEGVGPGGSASITSSLDDMGYNAIRYCDLSAYSVRSTMDDDYVFANVSHGSPGRLYCNNWTSVSAKTVSSDSANYSMQAIFGSGAFNVMKFAYFGSCYSAATDASYGNLPSYTTATLGADCALGFTLSVSDAQATYFESYMFDRLQIGNSVYNAASAAKAATYSYYGSYGNVNSYVIYGSSGTTIN